MWMAVFSFYQLVKEEDKVKSARESESGNDVYGVRRRRFFVRFWIHFRLLNTGFYIA